MDNDTTVPTAAVTAPTAGSTVSGAAVAVSASASDNKAVVGVQFRLDGINLGAEDTSAPYGVTWNTTTASNGPHTLTAVARDAAGNTASSPPVGVTVSNSGPAGPVAAYAFNEGAGITTTDSSGNNNTGSLLGPSWTPNGKNGGALNFDGLNDLVRVADHATLDLTNAMTLEAWVRPTAGGGWRTVVLKEKPNGLVYALYSNSNSNRPTMYVNNFNAEGTGPLTLNTWTHIAATYGSNVLRLYVNGTQVDSFNRNTTMANSTGTLGIGGNQIWNEYFTGQLDDVRIYNRALTPTQIQTDMNTPVG